MLLHILSVVVGTAIVATVLLSALQTVVLPKGGLTGITRFVFASADRTFIRRHGLPARFGWAGLYAPVSLVMLPAGVGHARDDRLRLHLLGVRRGQRERLPRGERLVAVHPRLREAGGDGLVVLTFLEALIGLGLVALLISFLPTLYSAYSDREQGSA